MSSQVEPDSLVQTFQKEILDSYRREFEQLSGSFRDLDGKAQGATAIAGIFLAAALSLLNRSSSISFLALWGLIIPVVFLIGTVIFALQALRVRSVGSVPGGMDVEKILFDLRKIDDEKELASRLSHVYGDVAQLWASCVGERRSINEEKAVHVWGAQVCLVVACISAALLILVIILQQLV